MSKTILIGGIKHSGKSTLGKIIAKELLLKWFDVDSEIERKYCCKVRDLFREKGEENFRKIEAEVLDELLEEKKNSVISLGGGAATNPFIDWLKQKENFMFVFINISPQIAYKRVARKGLPPFLINEKDPQKIFEKQCEIRINKYKELADIVVDVNTELSATENANLVIKAIKESDIL